MHKAVPTSSQSHMFGHHPATVRLPGWLLLVKFYDWPSALRPADNADGPGPLARAVSSPRSSSGSARTLHGPMDSDTLDYRSDTVPLYRSERRAQDRVRFESPTDTVDRAGRIQIFELEVVPLHLTFDSSEVASVLRVESVGGDANLVRVRVREG